MGLLTWSLHGHFKCIHESCPQTLCIPATAVRQASHFHVASEKPEAQRQRLRGTARRKPGSPPSMPRAILLVLIQMTLHVGSSCIAEAASPSLMLSPCSATLELWKPPGFLGLWHRSPRATATPWRGRVLACRSLKMKAVLWSLNLVMLTGKIRKEKIARGRG